MTSRIRVQGLLVREQPRDNVQPGDQDEKITEHSQIDARPIAGNRREIRMIIEEMMGLVVHYGYPNIS
jgi:hypothetical protein